MRWTANELFVVECVAHRIVLGDFSYWKAMHVLGDVLDRNPETVRAKLKLAVKAIKA